MYEQKHFEIIKKEISRRLAENGEQWGAVAAAKLLGIGVGKIRAWIKGQRPQSDDLEILARKLNFSPRWLLLGEGAPFLDQDNEDTSGTASPIPPEELDEKLTPTQRELLTYKRMLTELAASPERIIDGLEAIAMGKTTRAKTTYKTAEPPANPGYNNVHDPHAKFGEGI